MGGCAVNVARAGRRCRLVGYLRCVGWGGVWVWVGREGAVEEGDGRGEDTWDEDAARDGGRWGEMGWR